MLFSTSGSCFTVTLSLIAASSFDSSLVGTFCFSSVARPRPKPTLRFLDAAAAAAAAALEAEVDEGSSGDDKDEGNVTEKEEDEEDEADGRKVEWSVEERNKPGRLSILLSVDVDALEMEVAAPRLSSCSLSAAASFLSSLLSSRNGRSDGVCAACMRGEAALDVAAVNIDGTEVTGSGMLLS